MPELKGGFNAIGFSQGAGALRAPCASEHSLWAFTVQAEAPGASSGSCSAGGQFMRAVVERCQGTEANSRPRMHTLVTMGGQHQVEVVLWRRYRLLACLQAQRHNCASPQLPSLQRICWRTLTNANDNLCMSASQGIYNLPNCQTDEDDPRDKPTAMCLTVQRLVAAGAYLPFIRHASHFSAHSALFCRLCNVHSAAGGAFLDCVDGHAAKGCWLQGPAHTGAILQGESNPIRKDVAMFTGLHM